MMLQASFPSAALCDANVVASWRFEQCESAKLHGLLSSLLEGGCSPPAVMQNALDASTDGLGASSSCSGSAPFCSVPTQSTEGVFSDCCTGSDLHEDDSRVGEVPASLPAGTTRLMLCNLPCRMTLAGLLDVVRELGYADTFDHVKLPAGRGKSNLGYAFIHFKSADLANTFASAFVQYQFHGYTTTKTPEVRPASEQPSSEEPGQGRGQGGPRVRSSHKLSRTIWHPEPAASVNGEAARSTSNGGALT
eukprot:TRINITY_DN69724_c0_g1_i1.p1 TRINITY_DN69724_c0_g1~~TRINITY_DN69724_c0_g1_i1.p1  ORF type:complete len:249 (+),score=15.24 TRINITY_DN69724_c0_g1_i1:243-989(+)